MKIYLIIFLVTLISCKVTLYAKKDQYDDFRSSLPVAQFKTVKDQGQSYQFVEITAADIKKYCYEKENTIIYHLAPWCSPCLKKFTNDFLVLDSINKINKQANILVVNNTYGFERQIEKLYKRLNYTSPIYVLSNKYYGNVIENKVEKFVKELCDTCTARPTGGIFILDNKSKVKSYTKDIELMKSLN